MGCFAKAEGERMIDIMRGLVNGRMALFKDAGC